LISINPWLDYSGQSNRKCLGKAEGNA